MDQWQIQADSGVGEVSKMGEAIQQRQRLSWLMNITQT
jgi:hypothetical protein